MVLKNLYDCFFKNILGYLRYLSYFPILVSVLNLLATFSLIIYKILYTYNINIAILLSYEETYKKLIFTICSLNSKITSFQSLVI
jgi:hypothetical protein